MTQPPPAPLLSVFCRAPRPGRAKTRLAPGLGAEAAAALALAFLLDTLDGLAAPGLDREACVADPDDRAAVRALAPPGVAVRVQPPGDLGARMLAVVRARLGAGRPAVVLVGADCPTIRVARVHEALAALGAGADAALCPSDDGGYSLLALAHPHAALFARVPWSTAGVLAATRAGARAAGLRLAELAPVDDVDRGEDLRRLASELERADTPSPAPRSWHLLARLGLLAHSA